MSFWHYSSVKIYLSEWSIAVNADESKTDLRRKMTKDSRIPVSHATRELVKAQKRGGETYDSLLRRMVEQYDPDQAPGDTR